MKRWTTPEVFKAADFVEFCQGEARTRVENYLQGDGAVVKASKAVETDIEIPAPVGEQYRDFQRAGIAYGLGKPNVLIADPPGLGKTIQAIGITNCNMLRPEVLVICPAYLVYNWKREFEKWTVHNDMRVGIIETEQRDVLDENGEYVRKPSKIPGRLGPRVKETVDIWPDDCDVVITSDVMARRHEDLIKEAAWDYLIVDECQAYCNPKTQRTQFIFGGGKGKNKSYPIKASKRIFLTGTPMQKTPLDLWNFCKHFDPKGLGRNWMDFVTRYCDAYHDGFGLNTKGSSNLKELNIKMREAFMVRRNKKDVLHELPDKTREIVVLPNAGLHDKIKAELNEIENLLKEFEIDVGIREPDKALDTLSTLFAFDNKEDGIDFEDAASKLTPQLGVAFEKISLYRSKLAMAKAPMVKEHVDRLLASGEKIVLFTYHKEVAAYFRDQYEDCAFMTGSVSPKKRDAEVQRFQTDEDCRIMVSTIGGGGTGYTMTAAYIEVFAELDWTPPRMEQAEDRIWRMGQENACLIQYMVVDGSMDAYMVDTLINRIEIISQALDA